MSVFARGTGLVAASLMLSVVGACESGDDPDPDTSPTTSRTPASDPEWAAPSLPPSDDVDDAEMMPYVRFLQELVATARKDDCETLLDLAEGSPSVVEADGDFCELQMDNLADLDLSSGTLTFKGTNDNLPRAFGTFTSDDGYINVAPREDGSIGLDTLGIGQDAPQ